MRTWGERRGIRFRNCLRQASERLGAGKITRLMDNLTLYWIVIPAACLAMLPLLIHSRKLPQDVPNARSLHSTPVPRAGGMAIIVPALVGGWITAPSIRLTLGCAAILAFISFLDDIHPMPPWLRLLAHTLAAGLVVFTAGGHWPLPLALFTIATIVWMTNLFNFMDGADGLAGGMAVIGFGCYAYIAAFAGQTALATVSASIATCSLIFLAFNFHPARIFMGDIGSIPLGFLAATIGMLGWNESLWSPVVPLLAFSPFIADATITLTKRMLAGERFWQPHKNHYYQRMIRMGLGHRNTALAAYVLMTASAASAIAFSGATAAKQVAVVIAWAIAYLGLAFFIDHRWRQHEIRS